MNRTPVSGLKGPSKMFLKYRELQVSVLCLVCICVPPTFNVVLTHGMVCNWQTFFLSEPHSYIASTLNMGGRGSRRRTPSKNNFSQIIKSLANFIPSTVSPTGCCGGRHRGYERIPRLKQMTRRRRKGSPGARGVPIVSATTL